MVRIEREYFSWLCELVGEKYNGNRYTSLIKALYEKEFRWFVPNDDNRAAEGKNLRERFCEEEDIEFIYEDFPESVSMLEVMIALAHRCDDIMFEQLENMEMRDWFWKMIDNAGLADCSDEYYYNMGVADFVDARLNSIVNRDYGRNGKGGLFPLKRDRKDQRKVELWYQMNTYLVENYCTDDAVI